MNSDSVTMYRRAKHWLHRLERTEEEKFAYLTALDDVGLSVDEIIHIENLFFPGQSSD